MEVVPRLSEAVGRCRTSRVQVLNMSILLVIFLLLSGVRALPNFNSSSTEKTIVISWMADPRSTLQRFVIKVDGDVQFTGRSTDLQTASSHTVQLMDPGQSYFIQVEGTTMNGGSVGLYTETQVTKPLPPVLNQINQPDVFTTRIHLTWAPNPNSMQSNYHVDYRDLSVSGPLSTVRLPSSTTQLMLKNLSPGHNYSISVLAISNTEFSQPATIYENTVPLPPNITTLTAMGTHELYLAWIPAPASIQGSFRVTYEALGSNTPTEMHSCGSTSCSIITGDEFKAGQQISIKVYAVQGHRSSSPVTKIANTKPEPVQNLRVNGDRRQATSLMVLWEEPASSYTSFTVKVIPDEGTGSSPSKDGSNWMYTQNGLFSGKEYKFSVRTVSGEALGDPMSISTYTRPPRPPAPMRADADTVDTLDVKWSAPQTMGMFDRYRVTVSRQGVTPRSLDVSKSSTRVASFGSLRSGARYTVSLVTLVGNNIESLSSSAQLYVMPMSPRNVTLMAQAKDQLTVRWEVPPADPPNDFSGFVISIRDIPNTLKNLASGSTLEATFGSLNPGTLYTVEVSTVSGTVRSAPTTRSYYTKPNMPRSLHPKSITKNTIEVEWIAPMAVGSNLGYDGYHLRLVPPGGLSVTSTINLGPDETTYTFIGLFPGTEYQVELASYIAGTVSEPTIISVQTKPEPPRYLRLLSKTTVTLSVTWDAPRGRATVEAYLLRILPRDPSEFVPDQELPADQLTFIYDHLMAGRSYDVHVMSKKGSQQSEAAELSVTMNPKRVEDLHVTYQGTTSVEIQWSEPYGSSFDEFSIVVTDRFGYKIRVDNVDWQTRRYTIHQLSAGHQYAVTVTTLSNGEKSIDNKIDFATSPEGVATIEPVDVKTDALEIRWSAPNRTEFSGYDLNMWPNDGGLDLPIRVNRNDDLTYRFKSLRPGVLYNISISVVTTHGTASQPFHREIGTMPSAVINMQTVALSTNSIRVSWDVEPTSVQTKFTVSYGVRGGSYMTLDVTYDSRTSYVRDLTNLLPGQLYEVAVSAFSAAKSDAVVLRQATKPKAVQDVQLMSESAYSLRAMWDTSSDSMQDMYVITYSGKYVQEEVRERQVEVSVKEAIIDGLFPGELYFVNVAARSVGVLGEPVIKSKNTYPLPPDKLSVDPMTLTSLTARVTWVYNSGASYVIGWAVRHAAQGRSSWNEDYVTASVNDMTLKSLEAGERYTVQVYGVTDNDVRSLRPAEITVTTKPTLTTMLSKDPEATTSNTLVILYTENNGQFDHYVFTIDPVHAEPVQKEREDRDRHVEFRGLTAGLTYTVTVLTVSGDISSQRHSQQFNTRPGPPDVLVSQDVTRVTLTINRPLGVVNQYVIGCAIIESGATFMCSPKHRTLQAGDTPLVVNYVDLTPYTKYQFTVWSQVGADLSLPVVKFARTQQDAPGKVGNLTAFALKPDLVRLTWTEPVEKNGVVQHYLITYNGTRPGQGTKAQTGDVKVDARDTSYALNDLKGGYVYTFHIRAVTVAEGTANSITVQTPIGKPSLASKFTPDQMKPRRINDTGLGFDRFTVQLVDPFSDRNGQVVSYTLIVTTEPNDRMVQAANLPYWADNVGRGFPGTYQAIDRCADLFSQDSTCGKPPAGSSRHRRELSDRVTFVVGGQVCSPDVREYCNGRLTPSTTYYIKLRGYTGEGAFTDAPLSDGISTTVAPPDESVKVLVAVIVVLIILFLVLALAILFILYRRGIICSKDSSSSFSQTSAATSIRISLRDSFRRRKPHADLSRPVKVADFQDHVRLMSADSDFKFSEEYEDLKPVGRDQPCVASELPCNRNKNRFTNILPYDHSRVKLLPTDDEEGTDYINANYMPGFNSKREFIVTQGSLPSTRDDFWRMVWEQNCRAIVMLTKCVEKGREKCDHYWPIDSEPMFYGDLQVLILNETKCPEWIVTEFRISKGEQSRNIKHFHYIAWPDFGVPQRPQSLIRFVRLVRTKMPADGGPIITHCSAGVGRSGAYIAVDHLLLALRAGFTDNVDIYGIVHAMRENRSQMVQTEQQYICIHHCLECVLQGNENESSPYSGEDNDAFDDDEGITMDTN